MDYIIEYWQNGRLVKATKLLYSMSSIEEVRNIAQTEAGPDFTIKVHVIWPEALIEKFFEKSFY